MKRITATVNHKGGTGKTTTCVILALHRLKVEEAAGRFGNIMLVDCDPQKYASTWISGAGLEGRIRTSQETDWQRLADTIQDAKEDYVFVDAPANDYGLITEALFNCDVAIIPVNVGMMDSMSLKTTLKLVNNARAVNAGLKALIVVVRTGRTPTLDSLTVEAYRSTPLAVARSTIRDLKLYKEMPGSELPESEVDYARLHAEIEVWLRG